MTASPAAVVAGLREFLRPDLMLLPGRYPNRPQPGHVANNLLVRACGQPTASSVVRQIARRANLRDAPSRALPGEVDWSDGANWDALSASARAVFDPDRLVFPSEGSPALVDWRLASRVGSDDSFAEALWRSLPARSQARLADRIGELATATGATDPVSRFARVLVSYADGDARTGESGSRIVESQPTAFGERAAVLLHAVTGAAEDGTRLSRLRHFGTLAFSLCVLGMLYEGCRWTETASGALDPTLAIGTLVYTGETPGSPRDQLVAAAQRSLGETVERCHTGIEHALQATVGDLLSEIEAVPFGNGRLVVEARLGPGAAHQGASQALAEALDDGGLKVVDGEPRIDLRRVLPVSYLTRTIRTMGSKVGLVGPASGGRPRLNLETSVLAALTAAVLGGEEKSLEDFVAATYQSSGLIIGKVACEGAVRDRLENALGGIAEVDQVLEDAHQRLGARLVRAGLAREYSDGFTMVVPT